MVHIRRPKTLALIVCFAPLIILLLPIILAALLFLLTINMVRASEFNPVKFFKLVRLLIGEIVFMVNMVFVYGPPTCRYILNIEYKISVAKSTRLDLSPSTCQSQHLPRAAPSAGAISRGESPLIPSPRGSHQASFPKMKKGIPYEVLVEGCIATSYAHPLQKYCKLDVYPCTIGTTPPIRSPLQSLRATARGIISGTGSSNASDPLHPNGSFGSKPPLLRSLSHLSWKRPVILFVYGGGFSSGSRWQYWKLANQLREQTNAMVVVPDYPVYPTGSILEMAESVARALVWTYENCEKYGGSRGHVWMVGHSAGAHLASYVVLRSMMAKASQSNELPATLMNKQDAEIPIDPLGIHRIRYEGSGAHLPDPKSVSCPRTWPPSSSSPTLSSTNLSPSSPSSPARKASNKGSVSSACSPLGDSFDPSRPAVDFRQVPVPRGLVLFSGVYDLYAHRWWEERRGVRLLSSVSAATGGYYDAVSPLQILNALNNDPSTFPVQKEMCPPRGFRLIHSQSDHVVRVEQSLALKRALEELENTTTKVAGITPLSTTGTPAFSTRAHVEHSGGGGDSGGLGDGEEDGGARRPEDIAMASIRALSRRSESRSTNGSSTGSPERDDVDGSARTHHQIDESSFATNATSITPSGQPLPQLCPVGVQEFMIGGHATVVTGPMQHPETSMSHHETVVHIVNALYGN